MEAKKGDGFYTFLVILVNFYSTVCLLYVILLAYYLRKKKLICLMCVAHAKIYIKDKRKSLKK